jgi:hypothetical protein
MYFNYFIVFDELPRPNFHVWVPPKFGSTPSFVLRVSRGEHFLTEEQQRAEVGILDAVYDLMWLHLQGMPLPREAQCDDDLARIVGYVDEHAGVDVSVVDLVKLGEMLRG